MSQDPTQMLEFESGDKAVVAHGKRPEVKAVKAHVESRPVNGIMTQVGVPSVAGRPEGPHRLRVAIQSDSTAVAYMTPKEAYAFGESLISMSVWLDEQLALEAALAMAAAEKAVEEAG